MTPSPTTEAIVKTKARRIDKRGEKVVLAGKTSYSMIVALESRCLEGGETYRGIVVRTVTLC